uniref:Ribosomal protein S17 n=1 Tax=Timema bartmani TaxID=61472 RepID=A0A7R9I7Z2_9NEOP|nr:unnamed protein product [Timema bartmani]
MFLNEQFSGVDPLKQYFNKEEFIYAHDPEKKCKTGDIVLIQELPEKMTRLISHMVKHVVYPLGDITDPLTGKKVVVGKYRRMYSIIFEIFSEELAKVTTSCILSRDEIAEANELYGESENAFKYDDAPDRGWQEDKKDFTHRESYIKYHEFPDDDQPYAV